MSWSGGDSETIRLCSFGFCRDSSGFPVCGVRDLYTVWWSLFSLDGFFVTPALLVLVIIAYLS